MQIIIFILISLVSLKAVILNEEERKFLKENNITLGITQIPNQVLKTKHGYEGFSIDLFHQIQKDLNKKFKIIYFDTWDKLIKAAKQHKIDIIFSAQKTPSRLKYLDFTDTILIQTNKIFSNVNSPFYSLQQLENKKVALSKGSALEEYIKTNYPKIEIIPVKNELNALKLLNQHKVDAVIAEGVRAGFFIKEFNLSNIIPTSTIEYKYFLRIATNNEKPLLNTILSKEIDNIPKTKLQALAIKWGYIEEKIIDKKSIIFLSIIALLALIFSIYLFILNKKLNRLNQRLLKEIQEKEKALTKLQKLREEKLNEITTTLNIIAHQWKQPLNNISLLNQIIIQHYKTDSLNEEIIDYFEKNSKKQVNALKNTINDFLDLFKIEQKKETFDLTKSLTALINELSPIFEKENIKFQLNLEDIEIKGYKKPLLQILKNIINNAKDALKEGEIKNGLIKITLYKKDSNAILTIQDNAKGIPHEIIDKIFDPYFSTKTKTGSGLGLYMAKTILEEKMNSKIEVKNEEDGACFIITLPLQ